MTYQELLALINQQNALSYTPYAAGGSGDTEAQAASPVTMPGWYNAPGGGYVNADGGALSYYAPDAATGGYNATSYDAAGNNLGTTFRAPDSSNWLDTARGIVTTIGGGALLGNAGALLSGLGGGGGSFAFGTPEAAQAAATWGSGGAAEVAGGAGASALSGGGLGITGPYDAVTAGLGVSGPSAAMTGLGAAGPYDAATTGVLGASSATGAAGSAGAASGGIDWSKLLNSGELLAAGGGALAGIAGNGNLQNTQTSSSGLAPWMQPYAQDVVARQQYLANQPATNWALDTSQGLLGNYAVHGTPLTNAAMSQQQNVINGGMLNSNPYIDKVAQNIGSRMGEAYATGTRANLDSKFMMSGNDPRYSSAYQQTVGNSDRAFADSLGSTMSNLYMGNYNQERAAQDAAARGSTGLANFGVNTAGLLGQSGADAWQRPYTQLQNYQNSLSPAFGQQSSQTQNIQAPNNWLAGAGGAAMGAGLWKSIFG